MSSFAPQGRGRGTVEWSQGGRGTWSHGNVKGYENSNIGKGKGKGSGNGKGRGQRHRVNSENLESRNTASGNYTLPTAAAAWVPDPDNGMQKTTLQLSADRTYTHFFPLELTNKDYLRRITETVALGIKSGVLQISEDNGLEKFYNEENSHDMYYLVKQILAPGLTPHEQIVHRTAFSKDLKCIIPFGTFIAAEHLLEKHNQLSHMDSNVSRLGGLKTTFQAGKDLLKAFGASAAYAHTVLCVLEQQFYDHHVFKEARMEAFGWEWKEEEEENEGEGEGENDNDDSTLETETSETKALLEAALAKPEEARTKLVQRLGELVDVAQFHQKRASNATKYEEAKRLKELSSILSKAIDVEDSGGELGAFGHGRILYMNELLRKNESPHELVARWNKRIRDLCVAENYDAAQVATTTRDELRALFDRAKAATKKIGLRYNGETTEVTAMSLMAMTGRDGGGGGGGGSGENNAQIIAIPQDIVGLIIGSGGQAIKGIEERAGARVQIPSAPDPRSNPPTTSVSVSGKPAAIQQALAEIYAIVQQHPSYAHFYQQQPPLLQPQQEVGRDKGAASEPGESALDLLRDALGGAAFHRLMWEWPLPNDESLKLGATALQVCGVGKDLLREFVAAFEGVMALGALKTAGFMAADLKGRGFGVGEIKSVYTGGECCPAYGYQAVAAAFRIQSAADCKATGISAKDSKEAGFFAKDLKDAGFSAKDLKEAGFFAKDLKDAGFSAKDLKDAGFSTTDLKDAGFSSAKDLKDAGFSSKELVTAGFSPVEDVATAFNKRQMKYKDHANKQGRRVFCEGKMGKITDTYTGNMNGSLCKIQYDDRTTNTDNGGSDCAGYLRFANAPRSSSNTIPCYAIDDDPPPSGARLMKHKDPANKKGQRVFCEGRMGTITDTFTDASSCSNCRIQYDDGSKNTDHTSRYGLRFANKPGGYGWDTIPCYAIEGTLKEAGLSGEQLFNMFYRAKELIQQHGYSAEELKQIGFPWKLVEGKTAWQMKRLMKHKDPASKEGQRVWCEGRMGKITYTDSTLIGSYCRIQYDDGSKNTDMGGAGYLRFAIAPGETWSTIPCYAIIEEFVHFPRTLSNN